MVNHGQYWMFNYGTWGFDMTFNDIQCGKIISQPFEGHYCWVYHVKMVQVCFRLVTGDLYASNMRIRLVGFLRIHYTFKMLGVYPFRGIEPFKLGHPGSFFRMNGSKKWGFKQLRWRILTFKAGCPGADGCHVFLKVALWVAKKTCGIRGMPWISSLTPGLAHFCEQPGDVGWDFGAIGRFGILSYGLREWQWHMLTRLFTVFSLIFYKLLGVRPATCLLAPTPRHMLFLGTKEYPEENSFERFLTANSGSQNAFTTEARLHLWLMVD